MDWLAFITAFFLAAISPGLNMLTALAAGLNAGYKRAFLFIISSTLSLAAIVFLCGVGIGFIIAKFPVFFDILRVLGSFYLFFIAYKIVSAKSSSISATNIDVSKKALVFQGFASSFGDPLIWGYIISLLPKFMDAQNPLNSQFFAFIIVISTIEFTATNIYAIGGSSVKIFFSKYEFILKKFSALIFAMLGVWMIFDVIREYI